MSRYLTDQTLKLHRMAFKLCVRCGRRKVIKASRSMWRRESRFLNCSKCREKERLRARGRRNGKSNGVHD